MMATIAVITAINESSAMAAMIAIMWKPLSSDRSDHSDGKDYMEIRLNKIIATWFERLMFNSFFFHSNLMRKLLIRSKVFFRSE